MLSKMGTWQQPEIDGFLADAGSARSQLLFVMLFARRKAGAEPPSHNMLKTEGTSDICATSSPAAILAALRHLSASLRLEGLKHVIFGRETFQSITQSMTSWTDALQPVTSSDSLGASTSAEPPGASTSAEPPGQMEFCIVLVDVVLYKGPRDVLPDCFFKSSWDSKVDVAGFPGASHFGINAHGIDAMRRVLAPVLGNVAELEFPEVGPAIAFLNFVGATQEFWSAKEESSRAALPMRLVLGALAAGSLTPRLVRAAAIEWNRFTQGEVVRDLAIPLTGAQALLRHEVAQEANLACFVVPVAVHRKGYIFSPSPSFWGVDFSWSSWFPTNFPWRSEDAGIALALKGGAAAHMLHQHGFGDLDFYLYKESHSKLAGAESPSSEQRDESAAVMLIYRAVRALCSVAKRNLLVRNRGTLTIIMELDDQRTQRVQFFMHLFDSISQIMITSDLDATQIVYCEAADGPHNLYLSPLALTAYASGFITIRSDLDPSRKQRTLRRLACYVRRGFGICAPRGRLGASSRKDLRSLTRYRQSRDLMWPRIIELDRPLVLLDKADSYSMEGDLPVKSIAMRWEARKSLKAFTDYEKAYYLRHLFFPCQKEITYEDYADGKIVCSWSPPENSVDSIQFNINNRAGIGQQKGGLRAYLCSWSEYLPHMTFYPQEMFKFLLLQDKCSMPAPGVNELS